MLMVIIIVLLIIVLAGIAYAWYYTMDKLLNLQFLHNNLRREYEILKKECKAMKQHSNILHYFSLLRNPNKGNIVIAGPIENYGTGDKCSTALYATMYGDGRICGSYDVYSSDSSLHGKSRKINREPKTREEIEFFFGKDADWLWVYYEFYCDFVKGHDHTLSK